jgi:hypothetical protein
VSAQTVLWWSSQVEVDDTKLLYQTVNKDEMMMWDKIGERVGRVASGIKSPPHAFYDIIAHSCPAYRSP